MTKQLMMITLVTALLLTFTACADNFVDVRIYTPRDENINLSAYDKVYYADLELKNAPKDYDPVNSLHEFFLEDIPRFIDKDVTLCKDVKAVDKSENALLITGKLSFDVKIRNKISEKGKGKSKKKGFVKVHHWHMTLELVMTETASGKEIFKKEYTEKLMDAEIEDSKFNFETLFFKMSERFSREITTIKKMKRRYLLTQ